MYAKRSQIAVFIIVGIVIITILGIGMYLLSSNSDDVVSNNSEIREFSRDSLLIDSYVESCIQSVGTDAIIWIGEHGGYYDVPLYEDEVETNTPYYFYKGGNLMPTISEVEIELAKYMDSQLFFCFENFKEFEKLGFDVNQGEAETKVQIRGNSVYFSLNLDIDLSKNDNFKKVNSFEKEIQNIGLFNVYEISKVITANQAKEIGTVCVSCIIEEATKYNLNVIVEKIGSDLVLFNIFDNNTIVKNKPYKFMFYNKYEEMDCSNIPSYADKSVIFSCIKEQLNKQNYKFEIEKRSKQTAYANISFYYKVNASGKNLIFNDKSNLFNINSSTGEINFIPKVDDIGIHNVWISVKDFKEEKYTSFELEVKDEIKG